MYLCKSLRSETLEKQDPRGQRFFVSFVILRMEGAFALLTQCVCVVNIMSTSYPENIVKTRNMTEPLFNLMELGILALGMLHWASRHFLWCCLGLRMKGTVGNALYCCFLDEDPVAHFTAIPRDVVDTRDSSRWQWGAILKEDQVGRFWLSSWDQQSNPAIL